MVAAVVAAAVAEQEQQQQQQQQVAMHLELPRRQEPLAIVPYFTSGNGLLPLLCVAAYE